MQGLGDWPAEMALDKGRDDVTLELFGVVEDVMIDAERLGDSSRVFDVRHRTATRVRDSAPEFQRGADYLVARSSKSAAATDESTPPLMATRTFTSQSARPVLRPRRAGDTPPTRAR